MVQEALGLQQCSQCVHRRVRSASQRHALREAKEEEKAPTDQQPGAGVCHSKRAAALGFGSGSTTGAVLLLGQVSLLGQVPHAALHVNSRSLTFGGVESIA